jgi:hypothetical protein
MHCDDGLMHRCVIDLKSEGATMPAPMWIRTRAIVRWLCKEGSLSINFGKQALMPTSIQSLRLRSRLLPLSVPSRFSEQTFECKVSALSSAPLHLGDPLSGKAIGVIFPFPVMHVLVSSMATSAHASQCGRRRRYASRTRQNQRATWV